MFPASVPVAIKTPASESFLRFSEVMALTLLILAISFSESIRLLYLLTSNVSDKCFRSKSDPN
ncbi:hypothetical protein D3C72_2223500 [compost metagenome]